MGRERVESALWLGPKEFDVIDHRHVVSIHLFDLHHHAAQRAHDESVGVEVGVCQLEVADRATKGRAVELLFEINREASGELYDFVDHFYSQPRLSPVQ